MVSVNAIDALLPQTQCGECGYGGCLPYAEALAQGTASIDRCPPGGVSTVKALSSLLNSDPTPYLPLIEAKLRPPATALIREEECIGCTKCIQACPVDAIIGSGKLMHSVIDHECTGCGLCVEPCPVDCIDLIPLVEPRYDKAFARQRYHAKRIRSLREEQDKRESYRQKRRLGEGTAANTTTQDVLTKQEYILQALARVKSKKSNNE